MLYVLYVLLVITTFVLIGVLAGLMAVYQIRDRLDTIVKLLEKRNQ